MNTVGKILDENRGVGKGFGFLRVALAVSIIGWHSFIVSQGDRSYFEYPFVWISNYALLPMFFALSGFLIAGSSQRLSIFNFFTSRAARIFPALAVETIISALIIGPLITTISLSEYFADPGFFRYFQNIYGAVIYTLPGVTFLPPYPSNVNGVIWTIPIELACYVVMGILIATKLHRRSLVMLIVGLILLSIPYAISFFKADYVAHRIELSNHFWFLKNIRGDKLLPCFLFGVAAYNLRHKLPHSKTIAVIAATLLIGLGAAGGAIEVLSYFPCAIIMCLAAVYLVIYIGCCDLMRITPKGDYSYGLYIYCFPIQQIINKVVNLHDLTGFLINYSMSLVIAMCFAAFSWHAIEKPVIAARRKMLITQKIQSSSPDLCWRGKTITRD